MRGTVLITAAALAMGLAACSPKQAASPAAPPAPASEAPPPLPAASAPAPEAPPAAPVSPETTAAMPAGPAAEPSYRFSPRDFGRQERRIAALIANAESRDTLGETPHVAAEGQRARERCATRKCVEAAYAAEEARLRKWEGSSDIR